jgi:hypothetical protein
MVCLLFKEKLRGVCISTVLHGLFHRRTEFISKETIFFYLARDETL